MEPQIQYVTTSDGVSIAYYAMGQGPATLFLMSPWSHLEAEWRVDMLRMAYIAFAQRSTLVRLDPRGLGLSDRDPPDFKLDSMVLDIEAVVDRIVIKDDIRQRLADSVEVALRLSEGLLIALIKEDNEPAEGSDWEEYRFSEKLACSEHPECSIEELAPRLFSFNSPYGACSECDGLGVISEFDEALVVPDPSRALGDGAIEPWRKNGKRMNM